MAQEKNAAVVRKTEVDVYVMSFGSGLLEERMAIAKELWDAGVKAEFMWKVKPKVSHPYVCFSNIKLTQH
jgi:histidyl-tRNA synthetase